MTTLNLKKSVELTVGETYSICMRGARRFDTSASSTLYIYTPSSPEVQTATLRSQNHYRFLDLVEEDYKDNYDQTARTLDGLKDAMVNAYPDFESREIVTILRFEMILI